MTITFCTNFINHHQAPFADELYRILGEDFKLVVYMAMPEEFRQSGYPDCDNERPYVVRYYAGGKDSLSAEELIRNSDILLWGSFPFELIKKRIKDKKITFCYSERWFKKRTLNPKYYYSLFNLYTRYRRNPYYLLCASGFLPIEARRLFAFPGKCFKFGYFPSFEEFDINAKFQNMNHDIKLFWCSRFIEWKQPLMIPALALYLKEKGYNFTIEMAGGGYMLDDVKKIIEDNELTNQVILLGNLPNEKILEHMRVNDIFLFTSNREEGWGAVLNEAMSCGCAIVASNEIGAVPFLLKNGENGVLFDSMNQFSFNHTVEQLFQDKNKIAHFGNNAYSTIKDVWNPQNAARNFVKLASNLLDKQECQVENGPCSLCQ